MDGVGFYVELPGCRDDSRCDFASEAGLVGDGRGSGERRPVDHKEALYGARWWPRHAESRRCLRVPNVRGKEIDVRKRPALLVDGSNETAVRRAQLECFATSRKAVEDASEAQCLFSDDTPRVN